MDTIDPRKFRPEKMQPVRSDPPGTVQTMPSPRELHHLHILSHAHFDEMVDFYKWLFNAEIVTVNPRGLTFLAYDDHDHRIVIVPREGVREKAEGPPAATQHLAFAYASLGELLYVYQRMKERGHAPFRVINHGNSTSFYYRDPEGNTIETMMDNFPPQQSKEYKRHFQWSEYFGAMEEAKFDPDKMQALYDSGVPDTELIDRENVRKLVAEGKL